MKFNKEEQELIDRLMILEDSEIICNPYSGEECELEPLAVALYDYIKGCEMFINSGIKNFNGIDVIDSMRLALGIFAQSWPKEYYLLLD
jgi:hypothetical protein